MAAGAAFTLARPAAAQTVKVTASGVITSASNFDSSVTVGTPYTFSYLLDYSLPPTFQDQTSAEYDFPGANYGATATVGDYSFTPSMNGLNYLGAGSGNGQTVYNGFNLVSLDETVTGFGSLTAASVQVEGISSTGFFSSSALPPLSADNVANFDFLEFIVYGPGSGPSNYGVAGSVTSLSAELVAPAAVPEASTTVSLGVLLALGGLTVAARRRRTVMGK